MKPALSRRLTGEALGTGLLVMAVVGSGIMAQRLTEDIAVALLCNTLATGAALVVLILVLGPVSGAHLNPIVSAAFALRRELGASELGGYWLAQVAGGIAGSLIAHAMFGLPLLQAGETMRSGLGQWIGEAVATAGLLLTIFGTLRRGDASTPYAVGLFITAAYWFTSSTSFANPAVTIARAFTTTFAGIRPLDVLPFVLAQCAGGVAGLMLIAALFGPAMRREADA